MRSVFLVLQLQDLSLKEVQRLPYPIHLFFDLSNVTVERIIVSADVKNDLTDVVGNVSYQTVYFTKFLFVEMNDVAFKYHCSDKAAKCSHSAVFILTLERFKLFLGDSDFQEYVTLVFLFFIRFSSHKNLSFFYLGSGVEGCPSHKLCIVWFSVFVPTQYRACYSSKRPCGRTFIFLFSEENSRHFSACLSCHFSFQTAIRSTRLHTSHTTLDLSEV